MRVIARYLIFIFSVSSGSSVADAKSEVEHLMNENVSFAAKMLSEHGEFYPYGAALNPGKEIVSVAAHLREESPAPQDVIDALRNSFQLAASQEKYIATALFYDVRIQEQHGMSDAIAIELDHKDGYSVVVYFPYKLEGDQPIFGEIFAQSGQHRIFHDGA